MEAFRKYYQQFVSMKTITGSKNTMTPLEEVFSTKTLIFLIVNTTRYACLSAVNKSLQNAVLEICTIESDSLFSQQ